MIIKPQNKPLNCYLEDYQHRINKHLDSLLPSSSLAPSHLHEAMRYAVLNGGKRIRPLLVYATGEALNVEISLLDDVASAIELIHAYSLVHDDLPAMDNDDLRRGMPTCHKAFDEATAILVGDALQSLAFLSIADNRLLGPSVKVKLISCLAKASGSFGMAGGQALDLLATGKRLKTNELEQIHQLKTGALISACVELALITAESRDSALIDSVQQFASAIGLCFQIQDDILDLVGTTHTIGKTAGSDQVRQKATYTTINGLAKARADLEFCYQKGMTALNVLDDKAKNLKLLADYIIIRDH